MSTTTLPTPTACIINSRRRMNGRLAVAWRHGDIIEITELDSRDYEEARAEAAQRIPARYRVIVPKLGES